MRAVLVKEPGGPEQLVMGEVPPPVPREKEENRNIGKIILKVE